VFLIPSDLWVLSWLVLGWTRRGRPRNFFSGRGGGLQDLFCFFFSGRGVGLGDLDCFAFFFSSATVVGEAEVVVLADLNFFEMTLSEFLTNFLNFLGAKTFLGGDSSFASNLAFAFLYSAEVT
jgi:hypothetical protein